MLITITPNMKQIRAYLEMALNEFKFLPTDMAIEHCCHDIRRCLWYIDTLSHTADLVVTGVTAIEDGIRIKRSMRDDDFLDIIDRDVNPPGAWKKDAAA